MDKIDYKKKDKVFYAVSNRPQIVNIPKWKFIAVEGCGNPNDEGGEYQKAVSILYSLSYTIKMLPKKGETIKGYFEYIVPPLEGFWWLDDKSSFYKVEKSKYRWLSVIRQPDFVTEELFKLAKQEAAKKKKDIDFSVAKLTEIEEGLCVQCGHIGSFDNEPQTLEKMEKFISESGLTLDISSHRRHHEVYMSDPRKVDISKNKCILRLPVKRV